MMMESETRETRLEDGERSPEMRNVQAASAAGTAEKGTSQKPSKGTQLRLTL